MSRGATFLFLRTTRAALDGQAAAGTLMVGEPYFITDENRFAIGTSATTYQTFAQQGEAGGSSGGGSTPPTWGQITGTLSNQTDLQSALNAKVNVTALDSTLAERPRGFGFFCGGLPQSNEIIARMVAQASFTITGATINAENPAAANSVLVIKKNGVQLASATFSAGVGTATISAFSTVVAQGDVITVTAPASADTALANISGMFRE